MLLLPINSQNYYGSHVKVVWCISLSQVILAGIGSCTTFSHSSKWCGASPTPGSTAYYGVLHHFG
jgi:hypothetical protein